MATRISSLMQPKVGIYYAIAEDCAACGQKSRTVWVDMPTGDAGLPALKVYRGFISHACEVTVPSPIYH